MQPEKNLHPWERLTVGKGKTVVWAGGDQELDLAGLCLGMALTSA